MASVRPPAKLSYFSYARRSSRRFPRDIVNPPLSCRLHVTRLFSLVQYPYARRSAVALDILVYSLLVSSPRRIDRL